MVVAAPARRSEAAWARIAAAVAAACAVLPLVAPEVWSGFRIAQSDPVLSVIAPTEQPLSVRSPGGEWAMALVLGWFALACWSRRLTLWEAVLVIVGGGAALARLGNAWLDAVAMLVPLARQLWLARPPRLALVGLAAVSLAVTAYTSWSSRPPSLPPAAIQAATGAPPTGNVMADWRWAAEVQRQLGATRTVLAAGGLASEPADFWLDYVRVAEGHERWAEVLADRNVDLLVLDSMNQERAAADLVRQSPNWKVVYDAGGALVAERAHQ